jgi:hypothetical protein
MKKIGSAPFRASAWGLGLNAAKGIITATMFPVVHRSFKSPGRIICASGLLSIAAAICGNGPPL